MEIQTSQTNAPEELNGLMETVDQLIDLVMTENAFLRAGNRDTEELEELVGRKMELANSYYAKCKILNALPANSAERRSLDEGLVADRLRDLTINLNENRRLLAARHSATSRRVSAVMDALNNKQENVGTYSKQAEAKPANEHRHLSLVTGTTA
ncbi:hypothetical protein [Aestuariispira insulae]|uniref:FlgN protein n=1 Tax=Aestuariispira insulae TaxID=1461337 RepID=A0A3D9H780_9PROT|nr:hypothetical protein [Aestuariispira insulae]RED44806.1 hypothetical protein DFP90_11311 [Aestuariispira insulae]